MKISNGRIEGDETKGQVTQFSIKQNAHAIHVLSTSLYTNPIRAVIRELVCNAWDSHKEAGVDKCIDISLYSPYVYAEKAEFIIRDYGVGLAPSEVEKLYTIYFDSTKDQQDDNSTGYFGLGSKAPFSYTKEFTVISYWFNIAHEYKAFIDQDTRMPCIQKVSSKPTEEPNGLCLKIEIKPGDKHAWRREASSVFRPFPRTAFNYSDGTFLGVSHLEDNVHIEKEDYIIPNSKVTDFHAQALVGNILYPLPSYQLDELEVDAEYLDVHKPIFKFSPSEIDVTPSREQLHFSKKTKDNLREAIIKVKEDLVKVYKEEAEGYASLFEARCNYTTLQNRSMGLLPTRYEFGKEVFANPSSIPASKLVTSDNQYAIGKEWYKKVRKYNFGQQTTRPLQVSFNPNLYVIYKDTSAPLSRTKSASNNERTTLFYVEDKDEAFAFAEEHGIPTDRVRGSSSLPEVSTDRKRVTGSKSPILKFIGHKDKTANATAWEEMPDFDMEEGGTYVEVKRFKVKYDEPRNDWPDEEFKPAQCLNFPKRYFTIVGVRSASIKEFDNHPKWFTVEEALERKLESLKNKIPNTDLETVYRVRKHLLSYQGWEAFYKESSAVLNNNSLFINILNDLKTYEQYRQDYSRFLELYYYLKQKNFSLTITHHPDKLIVKTYPLLKYVNRISNKDLTNYILLIDENKKLKGEQ